MQSYDIVLILFICVLKIFYDGKIKYRPRIKSKQVGKYQFKNKQSIDWYLNKTIEFLLESKNKVIFLAFS